MDVYINNLDVVKKNMLQAAGFFSFGELLQVYEIDVLCRARCLYLDSDNRVCALPVYVRPTYFKLVGLVTAHGGGKSVC